MKTAMIFVKLNLRTKKFSGSDFSTGKQLFKNLEKIPYPKSQVIIYTGKGNNIHPSHWQDNWFQDAEQENNASEKRMIWGVYAK